MGITNIDPRVWGTSAWFIMYCVAFSYPYKPEQVDKDKQKDDNETDNKKLRTGSKAIVQFTFSFRSEFLEEGISFFFRDGSTKGYGKILEVL